MKTHFYDAKAGLFRDTPTSERHNTAVQVMAFELGLFPDEERERVTAWLPNAPFETRVILSWDYLCLLFENGFAQQAYDMITDPTVRWGRMMAEGSRTIWEGFEDIESHSHAWNAYPLRLFQQYLLGVSCLKPGFKEASIRPFFPAGIHQLAGSVCTPFGQLTVQARRKDAAASFTVTVPEGMLAQFDYRGLSTVLTPGEHQLTTAE